MTELSIVRAAVEAAAFDAERQASLILQGLPGRHVPAVVSDVLLIDSLVKFLGTLLLGLLVVAVLWHVGWRIQASSRPSGGVDSAAV